MNAVNPFFHVVIIPNNSGEAEPSMVQLPTSNGSCWEILWPSVTDYSIFKRSGNVVSDNFSTNGKLDFLRTQNTDGAVVSFVMEEGTVFDYNGIRLADLFDQLGTAISSGTIVDLYGSSVNSFRVYAPSATTVRLNGTNIAFYRDGLFVQSDLSATNLLPNCHFALGKDPWVFWLDGNRNDTWFSVNPETGRNHVVALYFGMTGTNRQFWQEEIALESGKEYQLSFDGRCSIARSVRLRIFGSEDVYPAYDAQWMTLGTAWGTHTVQFTTNKADAAAWLQFYFVGDNPVQGGETVYFDNIALTKISGLPKRSSDGSGPRPVPKVFLLAANYPNPFNPSTTLDYQLAAPCLVKLAVFDVLGRQIAELASGWHDAGFYSVRWEASSTASGIYYARFIVSNETRDVQYTKVNKLLLMK